MTAVTTDAFFKGRVRLIQPAKGFRAGTDSLLLAAAFDADQRGTALDIGCGAGGALVPAAFRVGGTQFTGLEIDADMAALAHKSVNANAMHDRVEIVQASAAQLPDAWQNRFDTVFSNPPFFDPGTIQAPGAGKEAAYL
ncbi:MAG: methyltransferase, partial [Pseudomonadota bacterium]